MNKSDYAKAVADYKEAIRLSPDCPAAYRSLAELLATCPEKTARDGSSAIHLALKANELKLTEGDEVDAWDLEILAAAFAEAKRFEEAMHFQTKAVTVHPAPSSCGAF